MDNYSEQLIKKNATTKDKLFIVLIIVGAFVLVTASLLLLIKFAPINLFLAVGIIYLAIRLINSKNVEYEYIVTNKDIDIDKVIAKSKRKRLISVSIPSFENFGKYSEASEMIKDATLVMASANDEATDYYADFKHPQLGNVRLVFTPDDKTLNMIKTSLPRTLKYQIKYQ